MNKKDKLRYQAYFSNSHVLRISNVSKIYKKLTGYMSNENTYIKFKRKNNIRFNTNISPELTKIYKKFKSHISIQNDIYLIEELINHDEIIYWYMILRVFLIDDLIKLIFYLL